MKKRIGVLVMACCLVAGVCVAAEGLPPAGVLVTGGGGDSEVKSSMNDGKVVVTLPITKGQKDDLGGRMVTWTVSGSKAHYDNGQWLLKSEDTGKYVLPTTVSDNGNSLEVSISVPTEGCDWHRVWGQAGNSDPLWISQGSKFYRLAADKKSPAYEFVVCTDGALKVVGSDYPLRP